MLGTKYFSFNYWRNALGNAVATTKDGDAGVVGAPAIIIPPPPVPVGSLPIEEWTRKKYLEVERLAAGWKREEINRKIRFVIMHHSWSPDRAEENDWEGIVRFHMSYRYKGRILTETQAKSMQSLNVKGVLAPWSDVGYQHGIEEAGGDVVLRIGRGMRRRGAHTGEANFNRDGIGFCVIGNYDKKEFPARQWVLSCLLVAKYVKVFEIPIKQVLGHGEAQKMAGNAHPKSCPGHKVDMDRFRNDVARMVA